MKQDTFLSTSLGFIAGYVDTLGFIALMGLFTAHVTGNFVLLGSELIHPDHGAIIKLVAFPAFILAVAVARLISLRNSAGDASTASLLLLMQAFLLTAFMAAGLSAIPIDDTSQPLPLLAGTLGAAAMGLQNAASRLVLSHLAPTTVMTGNVSQLVIDAVDLIWQNDQSVRKAAKARISRMLPPVLAFAIGAVCGAFGVASISFWALLVPISLLLWQGLALRLRPLAES